MKRLAIYLCGAAATAAFLLLALLTDGCPRRFSAPWQPDDGDMQGYILQLTPDSLVTALAPGHPVRVFTPDSLAASVSSCNIEVPRFISKAPMFDAAWDCAWSRLLQCPPLPFDIYMTAAVAPLELSPAEIMEIGRSAAVRQEAVWPLADPAVTQWVIAAVEYALASGSPQLSRHILDAARIAMEKEEARLLADGSPLWRGGGDGDMSGALPRWFDNADRFTTVSTAVNALAATAYSSIAVLAQSVGETDSLSSLKAGRIASQMSASLWLPTQGCYSQYLYGRHWLIKSPLISGTGNALAAASPAVTNLTLASRIVERLPRLPYGIPATFPFPVQASSPPETSPAAQGVWALACGRTADERALWNALAILVRNVALASSGEMPSCGSGIFGAYIGAVSRVIFGISLTPRGLEFNPVIPSEFEGDKMLTGVRYRNAVLDITVSGTGSRIGSFFLDGTAMPERVVDAALEGRHKIHIEMVPDATDKGNASDITETPLPIFLPEIAPSYPAVTWSGPLTGECANRSDNGYALIVNGVRREDVDGASIAVAQKPGLTEAVLVPLDDNGDMAGLASIPRASASHGTELSFQAEWFAARALAREYYRAYLRRWNRLQRRGRATPADRPNRRLTQLVSLTSDDSLTFTMEASDSVSCFLEIGYADGRDAGRRGTVLRSVSVNGRKIASVAMPRTALPADTTVALLTRPLAVTLRPGLNSVTLKSGRADLRPGTQRDTVMIDFIRITNF